MGVLNLWEGRRIKKSKKKGIKAPMTGNSPEVSIGRNLKGEGKKETSLEGEELWESLCREGGVPKGWTGQILALALFDHRLGYERGSQ